MHFNWNKYGAAVWLAAIPLVWILLRSLFPQSDLILPSLSAIGGEMLKGFVSGSLLERTLLSLAVTLAALLLGTLAAFFLAGAGSLHPAPASLVRTMNALFHPLPGMALLPLVILWLGTGLPAVMFIILHSVIWPMTTNLDAGLKAMPRDWLLFSRNLQIRPLDRFFRVSLPAIFPHFLAGLKIGWSRAWRALISAEMIFGAVGGNGGLGWHLFNQRMFMNSAGMYAGILIIMLIGISVEKGIFTLLEKHILSRWGGGHE